MVVGCSRLRNRLLWQNEGGEKEGGEKEGGEGAGFEEKVSSPVAPRVIPVLLDAGLHGF